MTQAQIADPRKLEAFLGQIVGDAGAAMSAALVVIGDRLGLYKALATSVQAVEWADAILNNDAHTTTVKIEGQSLTISLRKVKV